MSNFSEREMLSIAAESMARIAPATEEEFVVEIAKEMEAAGIAPELVHAFRKTRRIVTKENVKLLPADQVAEWNSAVADFLRNRS
jgi:hypothetical protein